LVVGINKVAAMFVYNTRSVLLVPIVQILIAIAWFFIWALCASFLLSQVPEGYTSKSGLSSWVAAMGTSDNPGVCNEKWPTGSAYRYGGDYASTADPCTGNQGDTTGITPLCWRCIPPRFIFDIRFFFSGFQYLWNAAFLIAVGQCTIAGAVSVWFFASHDEKTQVSSVRIGLKNCLRYHTGSLAFGSFILALVQFIRYVCKYIEKQSQAQHNKVMEVVMKMAQCCLWCIEKCIKFLNKNAYIQIALMGKNFCMSAKAAFWLWFRNFGRFAWVATLGTMIQFLGLIFIMASTTLLGYFILQAMHSEVKPILPILAYIAISYLVAVLYMNVFGLAVDTVLHCFIAAEEMGNARDFAPGPLTSFLDTSKKNSDEDQADASLVKVRPETSS
jgi:hypothetical protein